MRLAFGGLRSPLQMALLALPLGGAALLLAAEFSTLYEVRVVTAVPDGGSFATGPHHGYALAVIAVAIAVMAVGAVLGGSRPAAVAIVALSVGALAIVLLVDLPDTDQTGLIGRTYDAAEAVAGTGLWLSLAGAGCALAGGVVLLLVRPRSARSADYQR